VRAGSVGGTPGGFTLIETTVALGILAAVIVSLLPAAFLAARAVQTSQALTIASILARQAVEQTRVGWQHDGVAGRPHSISGSQDEDIDAHGDGLGPAPAVRRGPGFRRRSSAAVLSGIGSPGLAGYRASVAPLPAKGNDGGVARRLAEVEVVAVLRR
jgi:type II secretory pathway pseudopilin PulG